MKKLFFLFILSTSTICLFAQQETVTLKAGQSLDEFKAKYIYKFPNFVASKVVYNDGSMVQGKFNYNQLSEKIEFIGPTNDTLELNYDTKMKEVLLDKSTFRYDGGYFEVLSNSPALKMGMKKAVRPVGKRKIGAMGIASPAMGGVDSYGSLGDISGLKKLSINEEHVFSITPTYYFGDPKYRFSLASQKSLLKIMPDHKESILAYLKDNRVNFNKLEDLQGLMVFASKL